MEENLKPKKFTEREFGERLKALRKARKMTMDDIALKIGIARSTYAGYETQDRFAPVENLTQIAVILGTSVDYLVGLTDEVEPSNPNKNVNEYLDSVSDLHWNGIPLSSEDLKPLRDLFAIVLRERVPAEEKDKNGTDGE